MRSIEKRFWSKVRYEKGSGCWVWTGHKDNNGYGKFYYDREACLAHRVSYEIEYKAIPKGMYVCHHCDNPSCVRLSHLFLGTQTDNMQDSTKKGRISKGEHRQHIAKLTEIQVIAILKDTRPQREIAKDYNINQSQISRIKQGKQWKHVGNKQ